MLGSCVAVILHDPVLQVAGMVHALLPSHEGYTGEATKFADSGADVLLERLASVGAVRGRLRAKVVGGAAMAGRRWPSSRPTSPTW